MFRIAVCGCGSMASAWIDIVAARKDCEIVALVDANPAAAQEKAQKHGLCAAVYGSLAAAIKKERPDIVLDVTPPAFHCATVTAALRAGCHVFGEKPMADTPARAQKMVDCAEESGREYFVMQNRRYVPGLVAFRDLLQGKGFGEIGHLSADFFLAPRFGGFRDAMESPLIADMAIHTFDAARFLLGKEVKSVYAHEFNPVWSWYKGAAGAVCIFEMTDGTVFDYRGSWCADGLPTSWESAWRAVCADGTVTWDGERRLVAGRRNEDGVKMPIGRLARQGHTGCVTEMFDALKAGRRPQTDCRDNIKSIQMVFKALQSAKTGKPVAF